MALRTLVLSSLLAVTLAQNARTYIDCACSASGRGFSIGARDELRDDLRQLTELRNDLLLEQAQDPAVTNAVIEERLKREAREKWDGCVNNYSHEECVNADAFFRYRAGSYRTSFCAYNRATWNSGGRPACDKTPGLQSSDPRIVAGNPEIPSAKPVLQKPAPATPQPGTSARPAPAQPAPEQPAPAQPAPATPKPQQPATEPKPPATEKPEGSKDDKPKDAALPIPARKTPAPGTEPADQPEAKDPDEELSTTLELNESPAPRPRPPCFPGGALVTTTEGVKRMDELTVGEVVHVGGGVYSEVFMFTHKLADVRQEFVAVATASGEELRLTEGHYLPLNGVYKPARDAVVGDTVALADGTSSAVVKVSRVLDTGLYNPQTSHGDIVVDGVRTSTYTTAVERQMAHAMLAPLRMLCERLRLYPTFLDAGADYLARFTSVIA